MLRSTVTLSTITLSMGLLARVSAAQEVTPPAATAPAENASAPPAVPASDENGSAATEAPKKAKKTNAAGFGRSIQREPDPQEENKPPAEVEAEADQRVQRRMRELEDQKDSRVDWDASDAAARSERPSTGMAPILVGWTAALVSVTQLTLMTLCKDTLIESAEDCRTIRIAFASVAGAISLPCLIVGYMQRDEYLEWKKKHSATAQLLNTSIVLRRDGALLMHTLEL